ncbi:VCBS repeat-containing protein [Streptomyces sp. SID8379]|uniref:FG-GAP and VCBS repeat-containing protein n=1 Tax=unclassified Streptomyces TaxID=2593676 RepID=UPI00035C840A|nr:MULTISPECIES: FG-GAP and VCBS repeat-containing protein [unclassified Streptomyces]MYW68782.1 VCBS repeat-containing protein [Streptomyces sp. SID8379]
MAKHRRIPAPSPTRIRLVTATAAAAALTGGLFVATAGSASAATPGVAASDADFNGDGVADVAVSASWASVSGHSKAGQISVLYGGGKHTTISQNTAGVPGSAESSDFFGADSAYGDFNNDGYDDLAVGAPGEDVGSDADGGTAAILYGSPNGLTGGKTVTDPRASAHDHFGSMLEAGDFDGDGKDDLAVATPNSATVDVLRGGTGSAYTVGAPVWSGGGDGIRNLHSGDINGDGIDDLLVNGFEKDSDVGWDANFYLPGTSSGVTANGYVKLPAGIITDVGDIDGDGDGDVVLGLSWDASSEVPGAQKGGAVLIAHGSPSGPVASGVQTIDQDTAGVPGGGETGDAFGAELDLGDINGDGHLDLVVGTPGEDLDGITNTGSATVLYGAADGSGITGAGAKFYSQDTPGVPNSNEKNDYFGTDVHIDDLDDDGRGDVVIGASGENGDNGAVYALHSNTDGSLSSSGGIYTSTLGISTSGTPLLGSNFSD